MLVGQSHQISSFSLLIDRTKFVVASFFPWGFLKTVIYHLFVLPPCLILPIMPCMRVICAWQKINLWQSCADDFPLHKFVPLDLLWLDALFGKFTISFYNSLPVKGCSPADFQKLSTSAWSHSRLPMPQSFFGCRFWAQPMGFHVLPLPSFQFSLQHFDF